MKKSIRRSVFWSFIAFIAYGCASSTGNVSTSGTGNPNARVTESTLQNDCPLEKTSWLVVKNTVEKDQLANISKKLSEAAMRDAEKIRQISTTGKTLLQLSSELQNVVDSNATGSYAVSQEFYQEYVNNRNSLCAVLEAVRRGSIRKDESLKSAETAFRKISGSFEKFSRSDY
jgi:hypothetical protein